MTTGERHALEQTSLAVPKSSAFPAVPPLENGDQLTRTEFERRYDVTPDLKKAELLEGAVHMSPPVRFRHHGIPHADLMGWLSCYRAATPGVLLADNASVRLDDRNVLQPDAVLFIDAAQGGQARLDEDDYLSGPPEFVAEIASSTASIDLHAKYEIYRRHGVREYLVWRVLDAAVDWFVLRSGAYERSSANPSGVLQSEVFAGLWLDATALVRGDLARVQEVIRQGLASAEHAAFVTRLQQATS